MTNPIFIGYDDIIDLCEGWEYTAVPSGAAQNPGDLKALNCHWLPAVVPGTVAGSEVKAKTFSYGRQDYDQSDYWYRLRINVPTTGRTRIHFGGLATFADVFLDETPLLHSTNMFLSHTIDIPEGITSATLWIRFHALSDHLQVKRARPRWRTKLVQHQQLRWIRTTLLGRIPGWSPPVAPVGPWRGVRLLVYSTITLEQLRIQVSLDALRSEGQIKISALISSVSDAPVEEVHLQADDLNAPLSIISVGPRSWKIDGSLSVTNPKLWWPHTHGTPHLTKLTLRFKIAGQWTDHPLGETGFRQIDVDRTDGAFGIRINGTPIFSRGSCWTPCDVINFATTATSLNAALLMARDAGMNMLRIIGSMVYEDDEFYRACDKLGIMVWQDFMFSNLDYPLTDQAFLASVSEEVHSFLARTQLSPCLTVLCGNSDIEQQTSMLGLPPTMWRSEFFADYLPRMIQAQRPDTAYLPSSPSGGDLPFQVDHTVSHYYGVGAYLRPLTDARTAQVRFAAECLGFANVPDEHAINELMGDANSPPTHPKWKERVPRDGGAPWDFDDIRDHYTATLFGVDTLRLRYSDLERYLAIARVTTGEIMYRTITEWRRVGSSCDGALLWWLRDLWLGAGWGIIDARGLPKAAYHFIRRAMAPVVLFFTDEGLNGLDIHAINESESDIAGRLELTFLRHGHTTTGSFSTPLTVKSRSSVKVRDASMTHYFNDSSYAYKFGPPSHHVVHARWLSEDKGKLISESFFFPAGINLPINPSLSFEAIAEASVNGAWDLHLSADAFAQFVAIDAPGFSLSDNFFHLAPNTKKSVYLTPLSAGVQPKGRIYALNTDASFPIKFKV